MSKKRLYLVLLWRFGTRVKIKPHGVGKKCCKFALILEKN